MAATDDLKQPTRERPTPVEPPASPRPQPASDGKDDDTEGHMFTGGPSTKGEVLPRVPADNPHGD